MMQLAAAQYSSTQMTQMTKVSQATLLVTDQRSALKDLSKRIDRGAPRSNQVARGMREDSAERHF
ncbi:hypothetical protein PV762_05115 [Mitsuaria sp. CC2]|uniref:hypothetical protein n=1 Tax=Mitsuaria sp. CC2 TaxID=3029186 RepID=UPI003B8D6FB9